MSKLIKKSIAVPTGVTIAGNGSLFTVKGPKGEVIVKSVPGVNVTVKDDGVWIELAGEDAPRPMAGTTWSLVKNAIEGVTNGFVKILEIEGVGYRAAMEGTNLVLHLGYALPVRFPIEAGVTVAVDKNVIKISGIDKERVGSVAAEIRALKKPEPYKGKGIHYQGEVIRRKAGKKAGTTA